MSESPDTSLSIQVINPARNAARRRIFFFSCVLAMSSIAVWLMADILWRGGLTGVEAAMLALFVPLFGMVAFGFVQACIGFIVLLRGKDRTEITATLPSGDQDLSQLPATALLIPIYNEDVPRVYEGGARDVPGLEGGRGLPPLRLLYSQ